MNRIILLFSFCFLFLVVGNVDAQTKGTGICYFDTEAELNAFVPNTEYDCEFAMVQPDKTVWCWDRNLDEWVQSDSGDTYFENTGVTTTVVDLSDTVRQTTYVLIQTDETGATSTVTWFDYDTTFVSNVVEYNYTIDTVYNATNDTTFFNHNWTVDGVDYTYTTWDTGGASMCVTDTTTSTVSTIVCEGENIILRSSGGASYEWEGPNGFSCNCEDQDILATDSGLQTGLYTNTITDADGCEHVESHYVIVNDCGPIAEDDNHAWQDSIFLIQTEKCFPITQNDYDLNGETVSICEIDGQTVTGGSTITLSTYPVDITVTTGADSICVTNNGYEGYIFDIPYLVCDPSGNSDSAYIDLVFGIPPPTRMSTKKDNFLRDLKFTATGSTDCDGNPIDFSTGDYCATYQLKFSDGIQECTNVTPNVTRNDQKFLLLPSSSSIDITLSGAMYEITTITVCNNAITYDHSNSAFPLSAADITVLEGLWTVTDPTTAEIRVDKFQLDRLFKGYSYRNGGTYNFTWNTAGVNYFNTIMGLQHVQDVDGSWHSEGAHLVLCDAKVIDTGGGCGDSPNNNQELATCKGIKRVKESLTTASTSNVGTATTVVTMSHLRCASCRNSFTSQSGVPANYFANGGTNNNSNSVGGSEWWRQNVANTEIHWNLPTVPYNTQVNMYTGDAPVMPTNSPAVAGVYYKEVASERINGMISNDSSYYESPRINHSTGSTYNSIASWIIGSVAATAGSVSNGEKYFSIQAEVSMRPIAPGLGVQADQSKLRITEAFWEVFNQNGRIAHWDFITGIGTGGQITNLAPTDQKIYRATRGYTLTPQFMDINERWRLYHEATFDYQGTELPENVTNEYEIWLVETY